MAEVKRFVCEYNGLNLNCCDGCLLANKENYGDIVKHTPNEFCIYNIKKGSIITVTVDEPEKVNINEKRV
jgi:hypothetical protein